MIKLDSRPAVWTASGVQSAPEGSLPAGREKTMAYRILRAHDRSGGSGTGLGLTMVRQIAALHGGQVTVESAEGVGSCFTFRFPANPPAGQDAP